jgi:hypothetical protein
LGEDLVHDFAERLLVSLDVFELAALDILKEEASRALTPAVDACR